MERIDICLMNWPRHCINGLYAHHMLFIIFIVFTVASSLIILCDQRFAERHRCLALNDYNRPFVCPVSSMAFNGDTNQLKFI